MKHEKSGLSHAIGRALIIFLVLTIAALGASCKRTSVENGNAATANTNAVEETATAPPYQTKEPERYQATVVTTGSIGGQPAANGMPGLSNQQVMVARDGERRRMEFDMLPGVKMVFLQLPEASYMIYPAKKMYAEVKRGDGAQPAGNTNSAPPDFSADKLINQSRVGARYEKLGTEEVGGRMTTKYRVTTRGAAQGNEQASSTETIVWVDESLGMPIKSETMSSGGATSGSRFTMEIKDIKLEVEPSLFTLPKDYKKVAREDIQKEALAQMPGLTGSDGEEEGARKALYKSFVDSILKKDEEAAYATAREYLEQYPEESTETKNLKKWVAAYETKSGKGKAAKKQ